MHDSASSLVDSGSDGKKTDASLAATSRRRVVLAILSPVLAPVGVALLMALTVISIPQIIVALFLNDEALLDLTPIMFAERLVRRVID